MTLALVFVLVYLAFGLAIARIAIDRDEAIFLPAAVVFGPLVAVVMGIGFTLRGLCLLVLWRSR
ncbi:hypothetical protein UFOVP998_55 [uncultured Caudovirales phage]|uniref:Uncharacterized protein n=1 Tax=uncultured Caudovirales phage TaxID=2100421 RepID=A0A6J5PZM2_9CAUD|nr:hypothetical protein UFOVP998_55 [uncultured Caudovirales phage]CAB4198908.1 hypothetical protein UFOVP1331_4 [uncultured Caudovirales phage]CAB4212535.1 hypothetical protein UFOVP1442_9 [uncultured Caudovirales phage]CAB5228080.1 hypothetical protein UFOVP1535_42 [uncultured Caudovirales phage]